MFLKFLFGMGNGELTDIDQNNAMTHTHNSATNTLVVAILNTLAQTPMQLIVWLLTVLVVSYNFLSQVDSAGGWRAYFERFKFLITRKK